MPAIVTLDAKSKALIERIDKELARYPNAPATLRRGEIAAVDSALTALLKYAVRWLCDQEQVNPDVEMQRAAKANSLAKATAGQTIQLLGSLSRTTAARRPEVQLLCKEASQRNSRLQKFVNLRNDAVHDESPPPNPTVVLPALQSLRNVISSYRRAAGFDAQRSTGVA